MALAFGLQGAGYTPTELSTEAAVTLDPEGQGFRISRSALTQRAKVPNLDEATFALLAPDIVEAILDGRQPPTLQLDQLFKPNTPSTRMRES
jgi:hypothetical protein